MAADPPLEFDVPKELIDFLGDEAKARAVVVSMGAVMGHVATRMLDSLSDPKVVSAVCIAMLQARGWTSACDHAGKPVVEKAVVVEGSSGAPVPVRVSLLTAVKIEIEAAFMQEMVSAAKEEFAKQNQAMNDEQARRAAAVKEKGGSGG